jgi:hypothetical protein
MTIAAGRKAVREWSAEWRFHFVERASMERERLNLFSVRLAVFCLLASTALTSVSQAQVPVFKITPGNAFPDK